MGMRPVMFQESSSKTSDNNWHCFGISHITFGVVPIIDMAKIYVLCCFNKTLFLSETVSITKIGERAFPLALDFLSCKQCLTGHFPIFEHYDFASRSLVNFLTW